MAPKKQAKRKKKDKRKAYRKPVPMLWMHGNARWHETFSEVYQLVKTEPPLLPDGNAVGFKPIKGRRAAFEAIATRYIRYMNVYHKLEECLAWVIHPQKRNLLKRCVEGVAGRICELKHEMIALEKSLFHWFDDLLFDMGLTPADLKFRVPPYMLMDRMKILSMRAHLLSMIGEGQEYEDEGVSETEISESSSEETTSWKESMASYTEGSWISKRIRRIRRPESLCLPLPDWSHFLPGPFVQNIYESYDYDESLRRKILLLQSFWRVWLCKQKVARIRETEEEILGMCFPKTEDIDDIEDQEEELHLRAKAMWEEREKELKVNTAIERERFMAAHGHNMAWELKYNITQWLLEMRDLTGSFPNYPEEEEGGCERLFAMKTVEEVEKELDAMDDDSKPAPTPAKPKPPKKVVEEEEKGWKPSPTVQIPKLIDAMKEYSSYWYLKNEMDNVDQRFDRQMMLEGVRNEAGKQIRLQVDELMRYELDKLRLGIEMQEYTTQKAKPKAPKQKEKLTKDPLATRTVEDLYVELVKNGLVRPVERLKLDDIIGDYNFLDVSQEYLVPTMSDIKSLLTHLVLFPLSSEYLHSTLPLYNRLLLAGPPGVGKTMLVHAICRETGANLIEIGPNALWGKYEGPEQQEYLMNCLLKVGKAMEPTVFLVSNCHLLFPRGGQPQAPPEPDSKVDKPQRWVGTLNRMMNKTKKGDRMILIGVTDNPFQCNNWGLFDMFRNVVYVPTPEYGSRLMMWREFLSRMPIYKYHGASLSVLAKLSEGYNGKQIEFVVNRVLSKNRLSHYKPLSTWELIRCMLLDTSGPLDEDIWIAWEDWYASLPLMKRRTLMLEQEAIEQLEMQSGAEN